MKAFRVQYTVKDSYVATNKENIQKVMSELKAMNNPGIKYSAYLMDDGKTFLHFVMYRDEESNRIVNELPAFKKFREELVASRPEVPPSAKELELVGSAHDIFE